jgi:hypothetical protein
MAQYVAQLERYCRAAPYNWFNFYDFWHSPFRRSLDAAFRPALLTLTLAFSSLSPAWAQPGPRRR